MPFIQLTGGAYQTRSILASAQRMLNLYSEATPANQGEPFSTIEYPVAGKTLLRSAPNPIIRCVYRATTGNLYAVAGQQVFYVDPSWNWNLLGTITPSAISDAVPRTNPVSMTDNGLVVLMCDGSVDGYYIDITQPLASQTLARIDRNINTGWLGADRVDQLGTYLLANSPGTNIFYVSASEANAQLFLSEFSVIASTVVSGGAGYSVNDVLTLTGTGSAQTTVITTDTNGAVLTANVTQTGGIASQPANPVPSTGGTGSGAAFDLIYTSGTGAWNPLDFAAKSEMADNLVAVIAVHGVLLLLGRYSYESWFLSGGGGSGALQNNTFPFELSPAQVGNIGCAAVYSIATATVNEVYFLGQDASGKCLVLKWEGESATRISTHAIETQISRYPTVSDAVGYSYQQQGHIFYVINFPSAPNMDGRADAGATWVYDSSQNLWHERAWIDGNGTEYRDRANCATEVYGYNVCGDWENSNLYAFDTENYTENGSPVVRIRDFPHQIDNNGNARVFYHQLIANMQVGAEPTSDGGTIDIIEAGFDATNGTLLQNYFNTNDINGTFTLQSGVNLEIADDLVIAASSGTTEYTATGTPTQPNYTVSFNMELTDYDEVPAAGSILYVIGRATGASSGYKASVQSDGSTISLGLTVQPGSPTLVAMASADVITNPVVITLTMQSTAISVSAYRTQDGQWLTPAGAWSGIQTSAIAIMDSSWSATGRVFLGGTWQ